MIRSIRQRLFGVHYNYRNSIEHQRARGLLLIIWVFIIATFAWMFGSLIPDLVQETLPALNALGFMIGLPIIAIVLYYWIQHGRIEWATWLFTGFIAVFTLSSITQGLNTSNTILIAISLVSAGVLLDRPGLVIVLLFITTVILVGALSQTQLIEPVTTIPSETIRTDLVLVLSAIVVVTLLLTLFNQDMASVRLASDLNQIDRIEEFNTRIEKTDDEDRLFLILINFIQVNVPLAFAQVYLLDDEGRPMRRARGNLNHSEPSLREETAFESDNAIRVAAQTRRLVQTTKHDPPETRSHFLPHTNSALALPLLYARTVIGVLDIQTESNTPFDNNQIAIFSLLANQTTQAVIFNRRLVSLQRDVEKQQTTINHLQDRPGERQHTGQQIAGSFWDYYLQERGIPGFGFDLQAGSETPSPATDLPETLREVLTTGKVQLETDTDGQIVQLPIILRGAVLGAVSFSIPGDQTPTERQLEMAQNVTRRLAQALETNRLFEQSQAQALRERKASDATSLLLSSTDMRTIVNQAARRFNEALGAIQTRIYLQPESLITADSSAQNEDSA